MQGDALLLILVVFPLVIGIGGFILGRVSERIRNIFISIGVISHLGGVLYIVGQMNNVREILFSWDAFVSGGLYLKLDGFRAIHIVITSLVFMITTLFSIEYFKQVKLENLNRYLLFHCFTFAATMGVFLSSNLFTTFVFFEVMSLTSYVLVIHEQRSSSIKAARVYLTVGIVGGLSMLMGLVMTNAYIGTLDMQGMSVAIGESTTNIFVFIAGVLMLVGFGAKAGMVPLHTWLPDSYTEAPFPATVALSSVLSKAGIFGIIVMSSGLFLHNAEWGFMMLILGVLTMLTGAILALFAIDLKRTLACSSMSQIGFILVGIGMQGILGEHNALAVWGTTLHIVNHSLVKVILFISAAVIFMKVGSTRLNNIRGYGRNKPVLKFAFLIATLGITGVPLLNGYISKTLLHESIVEHLHTLVDYTVAKGIYQTIEVLFIVTGGLTVAYMTKLFVTIFVEKPIEQDKWMNEKINYISKGTTVLLCSLSIGSLIMGVFPSQIMNKIAVFGQEFMKGHNPAHDIDYFSWMNLKGAIVSILIGGTIYLVIVRGKMLIQDETGEYRYINRWPEWFNLQEKVYRPLISVILPFIGAVVARSLDTICAIPLMLSIKRKKRQSVIVPPSNKHFGSYIREEEKGAEITQVIPASLKYSLLTFGLGLIGVLVYIL